MSSSKPIVTLPGGDPRRPDEARRYPRSAMSGDTPDLDTVLLLSLMTGLGGFVLKLKAVSWVALFLAAVGVANASPATGLQHITSAIMFSVMSLFATYTHTGPTGLAALFPPPRQPAAAG